MSIRRYLSIGAAALLGTGLLTAVAPRAVAGAGGPRPTIVLVHGAWADGSSWAAEVAALQAQGYTVDVAPQPNRGPSIDVAYLKDYLTTITGPIILVGHSYGGFVATDAATGNSQVKALVYIDAFAPDEGDSLVKLTAGSGSILEPALTNPTSVFKLVPYPGAPDGTVDSYVLPDVFQTGFANDLPASQARVLAATQIALATGALTETSTAPAWKTIPSWALIGTRDRVIPPAGQQAMMTRAHAHITTVDASHLSLISHPKQVTQVIDAAIRATC